MKILFILPGIMTKPVGGAKVVYEYANRFASEKNEVTILYLYPKKIKGIPLVIIKLLNLHKPRWFKLKNVILLCEKKISEKTVEKYEKVICTSVETAYELNAIRAIPVSRKYYFIQDFEAWGNNSEDYVFNSYKFPMKKIVIANWLEKYVEKAGETAIVIPNGFDFKYFELNKPIENRDQFEIAMLWHLDDRKRALDAIEALKIVKSKIPQLHVTMFGVFDKPKLPVWFDYCCTPPREKHNEIYNNASIFVAASSREGFGLTVGEAMICGCAVACTDNGGFSMMVKNNETGLTSPVYDVKKLAENILQLIKNDALRIRLAKNGNEFIQKFTWENAFKNFYSVLQ